MTRSLAKPEEPRASAEEHLARLRRGEIDALASLASIRAPLVEKRQLVFLASEAAAIAVDAQPSLLASLRHEFCFVEGGVVASPPPGGGNEPLKLTAGEDGTCLRSPGLAALGLGASRVPIETLVAKHGWNLPEERRARLTRSSTFAGSFGLGRHEFNSLQCSDEALAMTDSDVEFASILYALWKPKALGLTLTYRCNAACEHCYNVSGPNRSPDCLGWSETGEHLTDWVRVGITDVGISGGEPFLYPDLVIELVARLKALGVPLVSPFTNGFWGADEEGCRDILSRLKACGFGANPSDQIKVSTGDFHKPFVDFGHVLNLAEHHADILGTRVIFDVAYTASDEVLRELIRAAKARGIEKKIQWTARSTVSNSGRARAFYESMPHAERKLSDMRCPIRAAGTLYPSGDWVYCSGTSYPVDHRRVGNLETDGTFTVLARAQLDPRVPYWQFGTFADYLADHPQPGFERGSVDAPERGTVCGTCRTLFAPGAPRSDKRRLRTVDSSA